MNNKASKPTRASADSIERKLYEVNRILTAYYEHKELKGEVPDEYKDAFTDPSIDAIVGMYNARLLDTLITYGHLTTWDKVIADEIEY